MPGFRFISGLVCVSLIVLAAVPAAAQPDPDEYNGALGYFFFGRQPSARAEAMGKTLVGGGGAFATYYNPAGIGLNDGIVVSASRANPYYLLDKSEFEFAGASLGIGGIGAVGFSFFRFDFGELYETRDRENQPVGVFTPSTSSYTLTLAAEPLRDLQVGFNFNLIRDDIGSELTEMRPVDIGLVRTFRFRGTSEFSRELVAAVSLDNVLGEHVVYDEGTDREIQDVLPKTLRVGGSYRLHRSARRIGSTDLRPFGLVLQLEYLDVLNSRVLDAIAGGAEVSIYELVDIRFGLIGEDHSFTDCSNCKKVSWDATYGFGLRIPVGMFTDGRVPLEFRFDLARMEQPSYVRDYSDWDPFTVVSLSAAWRFSQ